MREEKKILAILSFPGQRFLLSFNQFWTWLRKLGGVSRKATQCLAVDSHSRDWSGGGRDPAGATCFPNSRPGLELESSSPEESPYSEHWWLSP